MEISEETTFVPLRDILLAPDWQSPRVVDNVLMRAKLGNELQTLLTAAESDPETVEAIGRALHIASKATSKDSDAVAFEVEPAIFDLLSSDVFGERAGVVYLELIQAAPNFHLLDAMSGRLVAGIQAPQITERCRDRFLRLLMSVLKRDAAALGDLEALIVDTDKTPFGARIKWWFAQKYPIVLRHCYMKHGISHVPMPSIERLVSQDDADRYDDVLYGEFAAAAETTDPEEIFRVLENPAGYSTEQMFVAIFLSLTTIKHPKVSSERVMKVLETARSDPRRSEIKEHLPRTVGEQAEEAVSWWSEYWANSSQSDDYIKPGYVCTYKIKPKTEPEKKPLQPPTEPSSEHPEPISFELRWWRHFLFGDVCPDCGLADAGGACKSDYHRAV